MAPCLNSNQDKKNYVPETHCNVLYYNIISDIMQSGTWIPKTGLALENKFPRK